jgi:hypothetical protein
MLSISAFSNVARPLQQRVTKTAITKFVPIKESHQPDPAEAGH